MNHQLMAFENFNPSLKGFSSTLNYWHPKRRENDNKKMTDTNESEYFSTREGNKKGW